MGHVTVTVAYCDTLRSAGYGPPKSHILDRTGIVKAIDRALAKRPHPRPPLARIRPVLDPLAPTMGPWGGTTR